MTIGDRIRRIRKKRRLTQAELAMMSGLSLSAIQGYEQGRYEPKRKSLESIAEVFKIPVDELYDMPAQLGTNLAEVGTDCISRQQAIEAFRTYFMDGFDEDKWWNSTHVLAAIEGLPPAEPKRGRWIYHIDDLFPAESTMECNQCHAEQPLTCDDEFCPHCGAKMEVNSESN